MKLMSFVYNYNGTVNNLKEMKPNYIIHNFIFNQIY